MDLGLGEISFLFCAVFFAIQLLFCVPILKKCLSIFLAEKSSAHFKGWGLCFPFLYFSLREFRFLYHSSLEHDRFYLEARRIRFSINPLFLCIGRLRIRSLYFKAPLLHYFNRQESYKKKQMLPQPGSFQIKNIRIQNASIYIEDDTLWPVYRLHLEKVQVHKMALDMAVPAHMFFQIQKGEAQLAGGSLRIKRKGKKGWIEMEKINWKDIASLQNLPLSAGKMELRAQFYKKRKRFFIQGEVGSVLNERELEKRRGGIKFAFYADPQNYQTTLDLGLQKLIEEILKNAQTNWRSMGFIWSGRRLFKLLKKSDK